MLLLVFILTEKTIFSQPLENNKKVYMYNHFSKVEIGGHFQALVAHVSCDFYPFQGLFAVSLLYQRITYTQVITGYFLRKVWYKSEFCAINEREKEIYSLIRILVQSERNFSVLGVYGNIYIDNRIKLIYTLSL